MKKSILFVMMFPMFASAAQVLGTGEYRYGPDMPQSVACSIAEERAKDSAIARFLGEQIETSEREQCKSEQCDYQKVTYTETQGKITRIYNKTDRVLQASGYSSCIVTVNAEVEKSTNTIKFIMEEKYFNLKEFDKVKFYGTVNRSGYITLFNYYGNEYHKLYDIKVAAKVQDFVIPSPQDSISATLPKGVSESKEMVMFLFTERPVALKEKYSQKEMNILLSTIPFEQRKTVTRYVNIMK